MKYLAPATRHWAIRLIVALVVALATACIIGPKQDDPESMPTDLGDTGAITAGDTRAADDSTLVHDETGVTSDTGPDAATTPTADGGDVHRCGDAGDAGDAACEAGGSDALGGG